ncbi:L-ascorbate metabolism protein UlaG (beta-lactamase superfamily) [Streptomyces umbrinus]|uniref:L-ascorbate metabolism protein UlaG (Beta-lactamase superfamily) n=1 Tax=Streptomyces umbrinus TaxID=67370 RepID=A0ABU0SXN2_9ACTN|nr:MBL fold metallo-hydrolase [Streptomyces umbrinus]MDQ1028057.1 L-ascorbate metabolism protein UlaG (beta-lactamase superfamily) [Streptomyces umbrinus]
MTQDIHVTDGSVAPSNRGLDRRTVLRGAALGAAAPLISATAATASAGDRGRGSGSAAGSASFRWLGTAGWRIDVGDRTVLFDPYLTRFTTGLYDGAFEPRTPLQTRPAVVDAHIGRPELVLVSHSHWDHLADVPYIAKTTGARVVGTETTYHLLVALGVDAGQISVVKGGEVLGFGGITVEVVPSLHSRNKKCAYFAPGTLNAPPPTVPSTISDLPEGDTLAFQVTAGDSGPSAFLMGASDFSERAVRGLRPDLAMIAVPSSTATHHYVPRLLRALDTPGVVVPVHWDNFEVPLRGSPVRDPSMDLEAFLAQVEKVSPATRVVVPDYRTVYDGDMHPGSD